jgi:hypothetical protein
MAPFKRMSRVKGYSKKLPITLKSEGILHLITNLPSSLSVLKYNKLLRLYNYYNYYKNNDGIDHHHHHIYLVWLNRMLFNEYISNAKSK